MNSNEESIIFNHGRGPKIFSNQVGKIAKIWQRKPELIESTKEQDSDEKKVLHHLIQAQVNWDLRNDHKAVHHAQTAVSFANQNNTYQNSFRSLRVT